MDALHFCILPLEQLNQFVLLNVKVNEPLYSRFNMFCINLNF